MDSDNKYLCIDGKSMYSINYALLDIDDENKRHGLIAYTGDNCQEIFSKNDIPSDFRKIFVKTLTLKSFLGKNMYAYEYLTKVPIKVFKKPYYDYSVSGEMLGDYPGFRFSNAQSCNRNEILYFIYKLKQNELIEEYINCLSEIFQINIKTNEKTLDKVK